MLQLWGQVYDLGASEALLGCQGQPLRAGEGPGVARSWCRAAVGSEGRFWTEWRWPRCDAVRVIRAAELSLRNGGRGEFYAVFLLQ